MTFVDLDDVDGEWRKIEELGVTSGRCLACDPWCEDDVYRLDVLQAAILRRASSGDGGAALALQDSAPFPRQRAVRGWRAGRSTGSPARPPRHVPLSWLRPMTVTRISGPSCGLLGWRKPQKPSWRDGRADECDGLENRCALWAPWVRIPLPPPTGHSTGMATGPGVRLFDGATRRGPAPKGRAGDLSVPRATSSTDSSLSGSRPRGPGKRRGTATLTASLITCRSWRSSPGSTDSRRASGSTGCTRTREASHRRQPPAPDLIGRRRNWAGPGGRGRFFGRPLLSGPSGPRPLRPERPS